MSKKEMYRNIGGTIEILIATMVWGYGYIVIKDALLSIPVGCLMISRYFLACLVLSLLFIKKMRYLSKRIVKEGMVLGVFLYFSQYLQTKALSFPDTTAGQVAFITALYVVLVPVLSWIIRRKKVSLYCKIAIVSATGGLMLLTGAGGISANSGNMTALLGSIGFSFHILAIDAYTDRDDVILLTAAQFFWAFITAAAVQIVTRSETVPYGLWVENIWPIVYLGIFSTMIGFLMQLLGQRNLPADVSAMLLASESVFGLLFSVWLMSERVTGRKLTGCILMLAAVLLAESEKRGGKGMEKDGKIAASEQK